MVKFCISYHGYWKLNQTKFDKKTNKNHEHCINLTILIRHIYHTKNLQFQFWGICVVLRRKINPSIFVRNKMFLPWAKTKFKFEEPTKRYGPFSLSQPSCGRPWKCNDPDFHIKLTVSIRIGSRFFTAFR